MNRINFNVDNIEAQITPLESKIDINSKVGFYTNLDVVPGYAVYLEAKDKLTPKTLICWKKLDTVLNIQYKNKPHTPFTNYRVIAQTEDQETIIQLITRIK